MARGFLYLRPLKGLCFVQRLLEYRLHITQWVHPPFAKSGVLSRRGCSHFAKYGHAFSCAHAAEMWFQSLEKITALFPMVGILAGRVRRLTKVAVACVGHPDPHPSISHARLSRRVLSSYEYVARGQAEGPQAASANCSRQMLSGATIRANANCPCNTAQASLPGSCDQSTVSTPRCTAGWTIARNSRFRSLRNPTPSFTTNPFTICRCPRPMMRILSGFIA